MSNQSSGDGVVVCSCGRLTNSAILMNPIGTVSNSKDQIKKDNLLIIECIL